MSVGAALLIGNANYQHMSGLVTPLDDIQTLGDRMMALGLETFEVPDADLHTLGVVVEQFRQKIERLPPESSVIIYFAGHGVQRGGENYLLPIDARISGDATLRMASLPLSVLLENLCWRADQQKLVAIDACRTNRIPSPTRAPTAGLSEVSLNRYEEVEETRILYATQPGWVASDGGTMQSSPFCRGLLKAFEEPDRPLVLLTTHVTQFVAHETGKMQIPWDSGTITDFRPFLPSTASRAPALAAPAVGDPSAAAEWVKEGASRPIEDQAIGKLGHLIHRLKAKDTSGRQAYYFVLVEPQNEAAFISAIEGSGTFDVSNYGHVVASNYGEEPSSEVRSYLKSRYGFDV